MATRSKVFALYDAIRIITEYDHLNQVMKVRIKLNLGGVEIPIGACELTDNDFALINGEPVSLSKGAIHRVVKSSSDAMLVELAIASLEKTEKAPTT